VEPEQIAANLAFVNWTVLAGLAIGTYGAAVLGRFTSGVTSGFLGFVALCAAAFGGLAYLSDTALPATLIGSPVAVDPAFDGARRLALGAFAIVAFGHSIAFFRDRRAAGLAAVGLGLAVAVLGLGALAWGGGAVGGFALLVQLALLAAVTGGVFAAMILGHWYLVTPKLSERPLVLFGRLLLALVGIQTALFVVWAALGAGPGGGAPFSILTGEFALFGWLRLVVGLAFPLVLSWAAIQTARTRSMESATGLLYINVGAIASGTIIAAGLYFGAGRLA
jgi:hypothetical protein